MLLVIPMTPDHETKIKILIFKFLWRIYGGDDPPRPTISYDMSYQPKDKGGLSVKAPLQQQTALQLKFIKNITDSTDHSQWLILPRYWLGFYLGPLQPEWNFLINSGPTLQEPLLREIRHTVRWEFDQANKRPLYYHNLFVHMLNINYKDTTWITSDMYKENCKKNYKFPKCWDYWCQFTACYHPVKMFSLLHFTYADGHAQDTHFFFFIGKFALNL